MRWRRLLYCTLVATLGHGGCAEKPQPENLVARVGDTVLTESDLRAALPLGLSGRDPAQLAEARSHLVTRWVDRELLYQEARSRKLHEQARLRALIDAAEHSLLVAALIDAEFGSRETTLNEVDIQRYYDEHLADFQRPSGEIRVRHILLASQRDANARLQSLKRGEPFEQIVGKHSLDPDTRFRGGDLGFFSEETDPVLWAACESLALDKVSKPVRTEYGYHLFQVVERKDAGTVRLIAQVRNQIIEALTLQRQQAQLDSLLNRLRSTHEWTIAATSADTL